MKREPKFSPNSKNKDREIKLMGDITRKKKLKTTLNSGGRGRIASQKFYCKLNYYY